MAGQTIGLRERERAEARTFLIALCVFLALMLGFPALANLWYSFSNFTFHDLTGVPVILNTSFNIMGKPILHTAEDAILMFYTSGLDALVIDDWLLVK